MSLSVDQQQFGININPHSNYQYILNKETTNEHEANDSVFENSEYMSSFIQTVVDLYDENNIRHL